MRKKRTENKDLQAMRAYSNYFTACLAGGKLLREQKIGLDELTHQNFEAIKEYYEAEKERLLEWSESKLLLILREYLDLKEGECLSDIDGRTIAAAFRRFDIVEKYFKSEKWWRANI